MDEFLDGYSMGKKGRVRRGKYGTGMDQLDEIRQGLGKARISTG
jgi:protein LTV1